jgi:heparinase II/III-like protein
MRATRAAIGVVMLVLLIPPSPAAGQSAQADVDVVPRACSGPRSVAAGLGVTAGAVRGGVLSMLGRSVRIHPSTIDLSRSPVGSATWKLWYQGLVWLAPVALEAHHSGSAADRGLVAAYVAAALRTSPDPGSATSVALARANRTGWAEAEVTRRQQVLNCLVQLQPDRAVRRLLTATIAANRDPLRYYGLPRRPPHNHGLMANQALIESGRLLARPELVRTAEARLLGDVRAVRDRGCGMVFEQSAGYQRVNAALWAGAAAQLAAARRPAAARVLRGAAAQMRLAFDHLVEPDGSLAAVGDSSPMAGLPVVAHPVGRMLCRTAGWAAGRTSWSPTAIHYTLRFGPARTMHGHNDHGSVTWFPGERVLVDPGYHYFGHTPAGRFARSNAAHNVLGVQGLELGVATSLARASWRPGGDTYTVVDRTPAVTRIRSVRIDRVLPLLIVHDRATSSRTRIFIQRWHIGPGWRGGPAAGTVVRGSSVAGIMALDLRTGRRLAPGIGTALRFPTSRTFSRGLVLTARQVARSVSIFTVVYRSVDGTRPMVSWRPGPIAGTGVVVVRWGSSHRIVRIDRLGIVPG